LFYSVLVPNREEMGGNKSKPVRESARVVIARRRVEQAPGIADTFTDIGGETKVSVSNPKQSDVGELKFSDDTMNCMNEWGGLIKSKKYVVSEHSIITEQMFTKESHAHMYYSPTQNLCLILICDERSGSSDSF
jgi:hypothetical protein